MSVTRVALLLVVAASVGCRGERAPQPRDDLASLVDSLKPAVERAAGIPFRKPLTAATRTREQLRAFLLERIDADFTPERLRGTEVSYRLLGLLPDTLDLQDFLVDLLTEQVAGFYDPRTSTLYGMEGMDRTALRLILAHEMVHALQHQYLPLDSILRPQDDDDRQIAAHAILEGQATLASIKVFLPPGSTVPPETWSQVRDQLVANQASSPRFAAAPLAIREQLLFPYLDGADFMLWWEGSPFHDTLPYGPRMPQSSEQILQPSRYASDPPRSLRFASEDGAVFENTMGDLGLRILAADLTGSREIASALTIGWAGDRFRVYDPQPDGALVWYIAWDDEDAATRFHRTTGAALAGRSRPNYRFDLAKVVVDGAPATRIVIAPNGWEGWEKLPVAGIMVDARGPSGP
jgi:hypothetical protein